MPRRVVPRWSAAEADSSVSRSSARWYGKMTWARSLTWSRSPTSTPCLGQRLDLLQEGGGVDHDAVADDAVDARAGGCRSGAARACTSRRRRRPCARRWPRPDSGRRRHAGRRAGRRSSPWPRRPTAGPPRKSKPRSDLSPLRSDDRPRSSRPLWTAKNQGTRPRSAPSIAQRAAVPQSHRPGARHRQDSSAPSGAGRRPGPL